jgi:maleylacetoacetate isomerase
MSRSKILLYGNARSSAARRVRAVLFYKNIEFEEQMIDIAKGDPQYKAQVNPMGMVPAVIFPQSDSVFFESLPIMELIEELYPEKPILPKDPFQLARKVFR